MDYIRGISFLEQRGLGCPQKQSPVLSVPEMYMEALLAIFIPKNQSENLEQECGEKSIFLMKILFKVELKSYVPLGHKISFIRARQKIERAYITGIQRLPPYNLSTVFSDQPYHVNIKSSLF